MPALDPTRFASIVRAETAQVVSHLGRMLGDLSRAEELYQETALVALETWSREGVPERPGAWLMTSARNRAIDALRRDRRAAEAHHAFGKEAPAHQDAVDEGDVIPDDRLRLIFTCCHPALPLEAQVALTLRLVAGLTTPEVARAFLVPETTLQQRLVRAKRVIRDEGVPYELPEPDALAVRLNAVLHVVQLLFNEAYTATSGPELTRVDLAGEAIRLGALVVELLPDAPEARGLLASMQLVAARAPARVDAEGKMVLLEAQDRTRWDAKLVETGLGNLARAEASGEPGPFQLQAHISACHARARRWEETDWIRIAALYEALQHLTPSPVIALNRAVAVSYVDGPAAGLALLERISGLGDYHLLPATRGDLLRRMGRWGEAAEAYRQSRELTDNVAEGAFLEARIAECVDRAKDRSSEPL